MIAAQPLLADAAGDEEPHRRHAHDGAAALALVDRALVEGAHLLERRQAGEAGGPARPHRGQAGEARCRIAEGGGLGTVEPRGDRAARALAPQPVLVGDAQARQRVFDRRHPGGLPRAVARRGHRAHGLGGEERHLGIVGDGAAAAVGRGEVDDARAPEAHQDGLVAVELHGRPEGVARRARQQAADEALFPGGCLHGAGGAGDRRGELRLVVDDEALLAPVLQRAVARLAHPANRLLAAQAAVAQQQARDETGPAATGAAVQEHPLAAPQAGDDVLRHGAPARQPGLVRHRAVDDGQPAVLDARRDRGGDVGHAELARLVRLEQREDEARAPFRDVAHVGLEIAIERGRAAPSARLAAGQDRQPDLPGEAGHRQVADPQGIVAARAARRRHAGGRALGGGSLQRFGHGGPPVEKCS